jgi:hypothetical protein
MVKRFQNSNFTFFCAAPAESDTLQFGAGLDATKTNPGIAPFYAPTLRNPYQPILNRNASLAFLFLSRSENKTSKSHMKTLYLQKKKESYDFCPFARKMQSKNEPPASDTSFFKFCPAC